MRDATPLLDKAVMLQKSSVALPNGYDPTTGLTSTDEGLKGPRQCFRTLIQKQVEQEATSGRVKWPSRSARRAWVRDETKRRYTELTAPK